MTDTNSFYAEQNPSGDNRINCRWFGVLNANNINDVAAVVREMLDSKRFAIAEALYCDSKHADLRLISADCEIDSRWTSEPHTEPVRVFKEGGNPWFSFSAGGYSWGFTARPDGGGGHEDYHYPYFSFEGDKFTVTERAPAGIGYLHKRVFGAHCCAT